MGQDKTMDAPATTTEPSSTRERLRQQLAAPHHRATSARIRRRRSDLEET